MNETVGIGISFNGHNENLISSIARAETAVRSFASGAAGYAQKAGSAFMSIGNSPMSGVLALTGGVAGLAGLRKAIEAEARMTRIGIDANLNREQTMKLWHEAHETAMQASVSTSDLLTGFQTVLKKTGSVDDARESLKTIGTVAEATGGDMEHVGLIYSDLLTKMGVKPDEMMDMFGMLGEMGKKGGFYLKDLAANSSELMQTAEMMGVKGADGFKKFFAVLQLSARGKTDAADVAMSFNTAMRSFVDNNEKVKNSLGINWKKREEHLKELNVKDSTKDKNGKTVKRDPIEIMEEVIKKTAGMENQEKILDEIFGPKGAGAIKPILFSYLKNGDFRELDKLMEQKGDAKNMWADSGRVQDTVSDKLDDMGRLMGSIAKQNLAGPFEALRTSLDFLDKHPAVTKGGIYGLLDLGAIVTLSMAANKLKASVMLQRGWDWLSARGGSKVFQDPYTMQSAGISAGTRFATNFLSGVASFGIGYEIGTLINKPLESTGIFLGGTLYNLLHGGDTTENKKVGKIMQTINRANASGRHDEADALLAALKDYNSTPEYAKGARATQLDVALHTAERVAQKESLRKISYNIPGHDQFNIPSFALKGAAPAPFEVGDHHNHININLHVDKDGNSRSVTVGRNTTTAIRCNAYRGSFYVE
ncbi:MAG: phage tail tape measure protein [Proteobacteria bacterium]|nr:phage tail tape measure protein [Pseudomonadota bacterium]